MKKILIVASGLSNTGGIGNCLRNMLFEICKQVPEYKIDLLLFDEKSGETIKDIGSQIHTVGMKFCLNFEESSGTILKKALKGKNVALAIKLLLHRQLYKIGYALPLMEDMAESMQILESEYCIAIAYNVVPSYITSYVANFVSAKKKIAWSHSDIDQDIVKSFTWKSVARIKNLKSYKHTVDCFDEIVAVSNGVKNSICKEIGVESGKISVIKNFVDKDAIIKKAAERIEIEKADYKITILSVGRVSKEKGSKVAFEVMRKLREVGIDFEWWFVGKIEEKTIVLDYIRKNNLLENVFFLGEQPNPYPYFKACDIYVHTSFIEGYCTTTNEARMLGKPIVTTNVAGAEEQIRNGINGFVVEKNADAVFNAVKVLINDKDLREKFGAYNSNLSFDNNQSSRQIKKLLSE